MPRRYRILKKTGQRIGPDGRFMTKRKPKVGSVPARIEARSLDEHLRVMYSPKRFARALLERAYSGDTVAQQAVMRAVHASPNSQYDLSRLPFERLKLLKSILAEASVDASAPVRVHAPVPTDDDDLEPNAGREEMDEFSLDDVNGSLSQKRAR